eukprot:11226162-Lingulodinium_polyedra.AAC.1
MALLATLTQLDTADGLDSNRVQRAARRGPNVESNVESNGEPNVESNVEANKIQRDAHCGPLESPT